MKHIIVIDDTGSPGNFNETAFLKENRKSLVGVFIHSEHRVHLELTLKTIISNLYSHFGVTEIHLTDLVNRNKEFSKLSREESLGIIKWLANLFSFIPLPFFVQTCTNQTFIENDIPIIGKLGNFDFNRAEDQALFVLIANIKLFMDEFFPGEELEIVMDEGRRKNGQFEVFKALEGLAVESRINYFSSKEFELIQIADFFAYSINRSQMTIIKENKTSFDKTVLEYLTPVLVNQYSAGVSAVEVDLDSFSKFDYDRLQSEQRERDGNLESWKRNQQK